MAKATKKVMGVTIREKEDADRVLKELGRVEDRIVAIESREREVIRQANERAVTETKFLLEERNIFVEELERWARANEKDWEGRTLVLNFGKLFFRASSGAIKLVRSIEYVIDHLKAKKLTYCIRTVEEPDKDAIKALDNDVVKEVGCKREKPDYFHYEIFKTEVK